MTDRYAIAEHRRLFDATPNFVSRGATFPAICSRQDRLLDVFAQIEARVAAALEALKAEGELPADAPTNGIEVETPRDPTHGDLSTNAAMVLAKPRA